MRLLKYKLQNWGPHKLQEIDFPQEAKTIAICGENDKGKSWIVRGIGFTLSIGRNEYGDQSAIHSGEQEAIHELIFEHNNQTYTITKCVKGKGSEEEGTITKVNDRIVNRAEFEQFYQECLGLPHPSIWLPICISMQNQTDFHLRSKKRDREEALRAICQLTKIDNWKESLNQIQKEEEKKIISEGSKTAGILGQLENEFLSLERKNQEYQKKLADLKCYKLPNESEDNKLQWGEIIKKAQTFEASIKEAKRKNLQKANIVKELNLIETSLYRKNKELEVLNNSLSALNKIEGKKSYFKNLLLKIRVKSLKVSAEKKRSLEEAINKKLTNLNNKLTESEIKNHGVQFVAQELSEIQRKILQIKTSHDTIERYCDEIQRGLGFLGFDNSKTSSERVLINFDLNSIKQQITKRKAILNLLQKGLGEIRSLLKQKEKNDESILSLCNELGANPEELTTKGSPTRTRLVSEELGSLSSLIKSIIIKNLSEDLDSPETPKVSCPICESSLTNLTLKKMILSIEDQKSEIIDEKANDGTSTSAKHSHFEFQLEDSKIRVLFSLDEKIKTKSEIDAKILAWNKDFENKDKLKKDIEKLETEVSHFEKIQQTLTNLSDYTNNLEHFSDQTKLEIDNKTNPWERAEKAMMSLKEIEYSLSARTQFLHEKESLSNELKTVQGELKNILDQIDFYSETLEKKPSTNADTGKITEYEDEEEIKNKIKILEQEMASLGALKELPTSIEKKNTEILNLLAEEKSCKTQLNQLEESLVTEAKSLGNGYEMPIPQDWPIEVRPTESEAWEPIAAEWLKRQQDYTKIEAILNSTAPRLKEVELEKETLRKKLIETENSAKLITCAKKVIEFLDYKNAPRKLLESVVGDLFELTNRLAESLEVDIKLKLGKNLEFLTLQSRSGKWIEQKTERLGFGKGAILGICFRLACQKLLLPETGFLILDEPTANVDLKRKGLFKLFLQNLSQESDSNLQASQIILIEHDEDVVELCQTRVDIKEESILL